MSDKKFYEDGAFWTGVGAYYALSWLFTFYPAFIFGLAICQNTDPELIDPHIPGLIFMIIGYAFIQIMVVCEKYTAVVVDYVATLWPFLKILKHCYDFAGQNDTFPLPPVDWCPFW